MFMAGHGYITGKVAVCFYATAHSHSYVVLVFHFLYRLLTVKGSRYAQLFWKPLFYLVIAGCGIAVGASWGAVMYWLYDTSEFTSSYLEPILRDHAITSNQEPEQYVIAVFWTNGTFSGPRWKPMIGMVLMAVTMVFCYGYMVWASYEISSHMHLNSDIQSDKTHQMTKQLMRALMYQTMLPVITAYSPPLIALSVPLLGLYFPYIADISPLFFGIHPLLDGCVLIYTIKEYR
ncbi:hypothetical protein PRIPAC_86397 [Pristionchus pacificus]|nr:hypothetical protein PRIPAC_86397 [Pristionchus pacificus]